jgi:hypothetical protein
MTARHSVKQTAAQNEHTAEKSLRFKVRFLASERIFPAGNRFDRLQLNLPMCYILERDDRLAICGIAVFPSQVKAICSSPSKSISGLNLIRDFRAKICLVRFYLKWFTRARSVTGQLKPKQKMHFG